MDYDSSVLVLYTDVFAILRLSFWGYIFQVQLFWFSDVKLMQLCMMSFACKQNFYEDIFEELSKYGELESLNVCDNMADHMVIC